MKRLISVSFLSLAGIVAAGAVSFNEDIRPILADRCFACHGPDSAARKAGLRLDREETAKGVLPESGVTPVVAGKPGESAILKRMRSHDPDEVMPPPKSKLTVTEAEIELIELWIAGGAVWERHWAFIPPKSPPVPAPSARLANWPRNEIDHFILAGLEENGMQPSEPAGKERLLRRLSFDLTGLPPTLAELDAFLADDSPQAVKKVVDRLLASPQFGERLALEWLDVARYGDTDGLFEDHPRSIYLWRDWVVSAFNGNLPYREFISWQLAGDLHPDATMEQKIATGFLRNNPTSNEGGIIDEDYRIKYLVERVNTTATAFLGLTMECAQCHDHKFDPMTQEEYYQFGGFFNSLVGKGNTKGSTAPTLRLFEPGQEKRLAEIGPEIAALEKDLKASPPELVADFEAWLAGLERPVEWERPVVVSDSRMGEKKDSTPAYKTSEAKGRYVRIALPEGKTGFITLSEVEIYSNGRNMARGGKATQPSTWPNSGPGKAIDGNANGSFASCSSTNEQKDAWWEVDLGRDVAIDHIVIYNRNDCCPERLAEASVTVLDAERKAVAQKQMGEAPFRSVHNFNAEAPEPKAGKNSYELVLNPKPRKLAALGIEGAGPGAVDSIAVRVVSADGKEREAKLAGGGKTKFRAGPATVVAFEKPQELMEGEKLKLTVGGDSAEFVVTSDPTAVERTRIPAGREKRLAHYRGQWPGFAEGRKKLDALKKKKGGIEGSAQVTMIASDEGKPRTTTVLMRGEYDKPGKKVETAAPASIMAFAGDLPKNRLGLAQWMTDRRNPLTARVAVNRYWQMLFGTGIVKTSEDFGTQGERPSHQALLDYLAVDFMESGWDLKLLLRKMVTSSTYQQSSVRPAQVASIDPDNRLLSHALRHRLAAELIRDHALSVSGLLVDKRGGPGVHPYQPAELFGRNAIGAAGASFKASTGDGLYRRSLYTYWKRQIPAANMRILGADGRNSCRTRREKTNTPLQALVLLNDPQFVEAARVLAERIMKEGGGTPAERMAFAFRLATSRHASDAELAILAEEFGDRLREFEADGKAAKAYLAGGGVRKPAPDIDPEELAAYAAVVLLILNLDESISKS